jgi:hypothetical protein
MQRKRSAAIVNPSSGALLDASAPETTGANQEAFNTAGRSGPYFLQVWVPSPLGLVVGMADVVADRRAFATNRTMSHREKSFLIFTGLARAAMEPALIRVVTALFCIVEPN